MDKIKVKQVIVSDDQRETDPRQVAKIYAKIKERGYNTSYPITIDENNVLVDGGHRLEASILAGLDELPYVLKPKGVSSIKHSIDCNQDGSETQPHSVFDYAQLCANNPQKVKEELGWSKDLVSKYGMVKTRLHPLAWHLAKGKSTTNLGLVDSDSDGVVDSQSTIVDWKETHFRAIFPHLSLNGQRDNAIMRAQLGTINEALKAPDKLTAKWIGSQAEKHAWQARLATYMRDNLTSEAPLSDWKQLLKYIKGGVFGGKYNDKDFSKFTKAISAINEQVLGVQLIQGDCFQVIPTLDDKSIDLVIIDPPYNVTDHEWDKIGSDQDYIDFIDRWLTAISPKLKTDYHMFICLSPSYQADIEVLLKRNGWPLKSRVIWSHRNLANGRDVKDKFITMWEMVFHCGTHSLNFPPDWDDRRFEVQEHAAPQSNFEDKKQHETQKPLSLFKLFVEFGSKPGDFVLDTFAGSGTTGAACKSTGQRRCLLIEQSDKHCKTIENRLKIQRKG